MRPRAAASVVCIAISLAATCVGPANADEYAGVPPGEGWQLVFDEQFGGTDAELDSRWEFQNGPSGHILCSRWRGNAKLEDGTLKLIARKETRAGQDWTAASLWSKQQFQYGYFECRYRYAAAEGTNNSFWIMTRTPRTAPGRFEIDINEGHYPYEVNMNLHNHGGKHWAKGGCWYHYGSGPGTEREDAAFNFVLQEPIKTTRLRLVSCDADIVRVMEFRAFPPSAQGYPSVFPNAAESRPGVPNLAVTASVEASSSLQRTLGPEKAVDGRIGNDARWVSGRDSEPRILTVSFPHAQRIGCIQFISGWLDGDKWRGIVQDYRVEFWDGAAWQPVRGANSPRQADKLRDANAPPDLGNSFHVYGLEWNERELIYYFDGEEIRRIENEICHQPAPVWLSLAIMRWAGPVTDAINGKSMDVDWVRVWRQPKP